MLGDSTDNWNELNMVRLDLSYAFNGDSPRLIDEWQEVPEIWDALKSLVDRSMEPGRFILTGSSAPREGAIKHSGAGRIGTIMMRTMSLFESGDSDGSMTIRRMFDKVDCPPTKCPNKASLDSLIYLVLRGGWPAMISKDEEIVLNMMHFYLDSIYNDVAFVDGRKHNIKKIRMLMASLARNEGTLASISKIADDLVENPDDDDDIGEGAYPNRSSGNPILSTKTVRVYLDLFDRIHLLNDQPAFAITTRSPVRVGKTPKRHLADPSLAAAALGLNSILMKKDLKTFGFLFESLCERDLDIYASHIGGRLYHYRDHQGREVDAIIQLDDGRWGAFEIKLGTGQIEEAAESLNRFDDFIRSTHSRPPEFLCVICGLTPTTYRRSDGIYVVPITSLAP